MIENSEFYSSDKNIEASLNMMYGDYYQRKGEVDNAINNYKKAIKSFTINDRIIYTKIKLCMLYKDLSMSDDFTKLFSTIEYNNITDFQLKSLFEQISIKN